MAAIQPLPAYLVRRYQGWKANEFAENRAWLQRLADEGQRPRAMVISCCDSRVHVTSIFGADQGEFFIHRNIANLVPPYAPNQDYHGTSAAIEYAVTALRVSHVIVMGHSLCGGVKGCHDMCSGDAPELKAETSFVGRWMDILAPDFDRVADIADPTERLEAFEKVSVQRSLENLMTFPFVSAAIEAGELSLHGLWVDIRSGVLAQLNPDTGTFSSLEGVPTA
jgi:carbonic anhydrase